MSSKVEVIESVMQASDNTSTWERSMLREVLAEIAPEALKSLLEE